MGRCPFCGAELRSTLATAAALDVTDRNIRARLRRQTMVGMRLGHTWLVPAQSDQPTTAAQPGKEVACPGCGERLFSAQQAAAELGVSPSRVHAILKRHPERLWAVRVGRRWLIPISGISSYKSRRDTVEKLAEAITDDEIDPEKIAAALVPPDLAEPLLPDDEVLEPAPAEEEETAPVKQPNCWCPAYNYPHRPGGGRCPHRFDPVPKPG